MMEKFKGFTREFEKQLRKLIENENKIKTVKQKIKELLSTKQ